jgi:hypothetical protein
MAEVNTEAAIRQQAAAEEFNARCNAVEAAGSKAFGDKWVQAKNDLALLDDHGRIPMDILQVALETEDPAQVLFELGRDLGKADELMAMPALKRAIAMNDLAKAKLSVPARQQSKATPPVAARSAADDTPRDSDSDEEWNRKEGLRERRLLDARRKRVWL